MYHCVGFKRMNTKPHGVDFGRGEQGDYGAAQKSCLLWHKLLGNQFGYMQEAVIHLLFCIIQISMVFFRSQHVLLCLHLYTDTQFRVKSTWNQRNLSYSCIFSCFIYHISCQPKWQKYPSCKYHQAKKKKLLTHFSVIPLSVYRFCSVEAPRNFLWSKMWFAHTGYLKENLDGNSKNTLHF